MSGALTIGELARLTGVPTKTIRYYEQIALLPTAQRASNGYRLYSDRAVQLLRFVRRARDLGFSIEDVAELLALWDDAERTSGEVKQLARRHIGRVEAKISELQGLRRTLQDLVERCHGDDRPDCPILDDLADGPKPESHTPVEATYKVSGMTCQGCVKSVTNALQRLSPELQIEVSLERGTATVRGDHDEAAIARTVEDAGFEFGGKA